MYATCCVMDLGLFVSLGWIGLSEGSRVVKEFAIFSNMGAWGERDKK